MSKMLFGRVAAVEIETGSGKKKTFSNPPFTIEFHLKYAIGNGSTTTSGTLTLYNPNQETVQMVTVPKSWEKPKFPVVTITAGYKEDNGSVFVGEIYEVDFQKDKLDTVLQMKIRDKTKDWAKKYINKTYKKMNVKQIIPDMLLIFFARVLSPHR